MASGARLAPESRRSGWLAGKRHVPPPVSISAWMTVCAVMAALDRLAPAVSMGCSGTRLGYDTRGGAAGADGGFPQFEGWRAAGMGAWEHAWIG